MTPDEIIEVLQVAKTGRQWQSDASGHWVIPHDQSFANLIAHINMSYTVRLAPLPDEITIPARVIPAPLREAPRIGKMVYLADPTMENFCFAFDWTDCEANHTVLERGLIHATEGNAIKASKAMCPYA